MCLRWQDGIEYIHSGSAKMDMSCGLSFCFLTFPFIEYIYNLRNFAKSLNANWILFIEFYKIHHISNPSLT